MATYSKIVDPNGGGDYTSISAWEAGEQTLYASGDIAIADCRRTGSTIDTAAVTIAGWTTGVIPQVIANASHRHNGSISGTGYDLSPTTNTNVLVISVPNTLVDGLRIKGNTSQAYKAAIDLTTGSANSSKIINNLVYDWGNTGTNWSSAINLSGGNNTFEDGLCANNIVIALSGVGARVGGGIQADLIYDNYDLCNNTVYGFSNTGSFGIQAQGDSAHLVGRVKNNISVNCATCFICTYADTSSDYNVSSDSSAPGSNVATGKTSYTDYFVSPSTGDFHTKNSSTTLFGISGTDLSSLFTTDIDGDTRSSWDIGADEYVASGQTGSLTDTFSFSGSHTPLAHYSSGLTDSIGLGEGKTSLGNYLASLADSMALDGAYLPLAGYLAALSDSVGLDDARTPLLGFWASLSDSVTLGEASAALAKYRGSLVDSLTMADTVAGIAALIASLSDQVVLTGQESASTLSGGELSDTITLSDSTQAIAALFASLDETITLSDAVIGLLAAKASLSDILTVADDRSAIGSLIAGLIDNLAFVDSVAGVPGVPGQSAAISDIIQLSDSRAVTGHYLVAINDSLSMVDAQTAIAKYLQTIADILQLSDVVAVETSGVTGPLTISVSVLRSTITYTVLRSSVLADVLYPTVNHEII